MRPGAKNRLLELLFFSLHSRNGKKPPAFLQTFKDFLCGFIRSLGL